MIIGSSKDLPLIREKFKIKIIFLGDFRNLSHKFEFLTQIREKK